MASSLCSASRTLCLGMTSSFIASSLARGGGGGRAVKPRGGGGFLCVRCCVRANREGRLFIGGEAKNVGGKGFLDEVGGKDG
jgi:hypothetical protein